MPNAFDKGEGLLGRNLRSNLEAAHARFLELMYDERHRKRYRKTTEIAVDIVRRIEDEGHFPEADDAFDNGLLNLNLAREIEKRGQYWTSELEVSRHINGKGRWRRIDEVAAELKEPHRYTPFFSDQCVASGSQTHLDKLELSLDLRAVSRVRQAKCGF